MFIAGKKSKNVVLTYLRGLPDLNWLLLNSGDAVIRIFVDY